MTRRAVYSSVFRVIEFSSETTQTGKSLHRAGLGICMTDSADRARRIGELKCVTSGAWQVTVPARESDPRRVVVAHVADEARQPRMVLIAVTESGVIRRLRRIRYFNLNRVRGTGGGNNLGQRVFAKRDIPKRYYEAGREQAHDGSYLNFDFRS